MDHTLYRYSALPARDHRQPGSVTGLSAFVVLYLEHWEFESPAGALRDPRFVGEFGSFSPDYRSWSQREYGLRIGIFRVIEALRSAGLRPVIAANALAVQRLPLLVKTFQDWGCEWLAHGIAATQMMHSAMSLEQQRACVQSSMAAIQQATGVAPLGWLSQDWGTSPDTPRLLAEAGIRYTLDWSNDDQCYWLQTQPRLLGIPLSSEWDDVQCQWLRNLEPQAHSELTLAAFDRLHAECDREQRSAVFGLSLHPWVCGMPSRIRYLRELLGALVQRPGVQWSDTRDIFQGHCHDEKDGDHGLS